MFALLSRLCKSSAAAAAPAHTRPALRRRLLGGLFAVGILAACDPGAMGSIGGGPSINTQAPIPVALLVPGGSGQAGDEALARALENAARLAVADLQGVQIDLRVYNTSGQASIAAQQAAQAVADGALIILGPVFGASATAAGQAVAARGINVLSFSNNTDVAGGNVFVLGPTFQNTADRLVAYARTQGKASILVVHERNASGEQGRRAIERAAARSGVALAGVQGFDFSQQGIVEALPAIANAARTGNADAVFFTSNTAGALPLLTQLLPDNRVGPAEYQFMGLSRWDIPANTLALPGMQGGWFALPDPALSAQFEQRYTAAYGQAPHPIAGLAYDGIAAIGALARAGQTDALTRTALTQAAGFAGVNGVFRLLPDGTNERGLAVARISNNAVQVIDPAPRRFSGPGF